MTLGSEDGAARFVVVAVTAGAPKVRFADDYSAARFPARHPALTSADRDAAASTANGWQVIDAADAVMVGPLLPASHWGATRSGR